MKTVDWYHFVGQFLFSGVIASDGKKAVSSERMVDLSDPEFVLIPWEVLRKEAIEMLSK